MKEIFVQDLNPLEGSEITDLFAISEKSVRKSRNGKFFIRLMCVDRTGQVTGFIWDNVPKLRDTFSVGDIVKLKGLVTTFENNMQLSISNIRKAEENEYQISDFAPTTTKDTDKLLERLFGFIDSIKMSIYLSFCILSLMIRNCWKSSQNHPLPRTGIIMLLEGFFTIQ